MKTLCQVEAARRRRTRRVRVPARETWRQGCERLPGAEGGTRGEVPAGARALPEAAAMSPGPVGLRAIMESYAQRGNFMVCKLHLEKAVHIGKKQNSLFLAPSTRDGAQVRLLAPTSRLPHPPAFQRFQAVYLLLFCKECQHLVLFIYK